MNQFLRMVLKSSESMNSVGAAHGTQNLCVGFFAEDMQALGYATKTKWKFFEPKQQ